MSKRPWMPLYVGDYLKDTSHLSVAQSGAYLHLIMHYWINDGLPDNDPALARIAKVSPRTWGRYRPILLKFFRNGWKHKRIDAEIRAVSLKSLKKKRGVGGKMPTSEQKSANDFNGKISHTHSHKERKKEEDARAREEKYHGKQKPTLRDAIAQLGQSAAEDLRRADEYERLAREAERLDQEGGADVVRLLPHRRRS